MNLGFFLEFNLWLIGVMVRTRMNGLNLQILIKIYLKHYKTCNTLENILWWLLELW